MRTNDDIEAYLIQLDMPYEEIGEGMWVLHDEYEHINNIVIYHTDPVIIFRVKLMELPEDNRLELFQTLLTLNATDMVHGAYAIEENNIVCVDSLQSENLDFNEFQASIEALSFVISAHYDILKGFRSTAEIEASAKNSEEETETEG